MVSKRPASTGERTRYYQQRPRRIPPEFCTDESLDVRVLKGGGARAERRPDPDTDLLEVLALWLADVSAEALIAARSSPTYQDGFDGSSEADR